MQIRESLVLAEFCLLFLQLYCGVMATVHENWKSTCSRCNNRRTSKGGDVTKARDYRADYGINCKAEEALISINLHHPCT